MGKTLPAVCAHWCSCCLRVQRKKKGKEHVFITDEEMCGIFNMDCDGSKGMLVDLESPQFGRMWMHADDIYTHSFQ